MLSRASQGCSVNFLEVCPSHHSNASIFCAYLNRKLHFLRYLLFHQTTFLQHNTKVNGKYIVCSPPSLGCSIASMMEMTTMMRMADNNSSLMEYMKCSYYHHPLYDLGSINCSNIVRQQHIMDVNIFSKLGICIF